MEAPPAPRVVKLVLRYDGAAYSGWQRQPDRPTVQGALEAAIAAVVGANVAAHGAGRTDAGVHALGQVAHFETDSKLPAATFVRALNANLPDDVVVVGATDAPPGFHARFSALRKTYLYRFHVSAERDPLLRRFSMHLRRAPDVLAMRAAASSLVGRHDFRSFASEHQDEKDSVRTLHRLRVLDRPLGPVIVATANGFLMHMVRNLAGVLLRAGHGSLAPAGAGGPAAEAARILAARDRRVAPAALPAHALFLWRVDY